MTPFDQQTVQIARRNHPADRRRRANPRRLQGIHRNMRKGENALEHQRHDRHKNQRAPHFMRQHPIQFIAKVSRRAAIIRS